jgi:hypothetical protein
VPWPPSYLRSVSKPGRGQSRRLRRGAGRRRSPGRNTGRHLCGGRPSGSPYGTFPRHDAGGLRADLDSLGVATERPRR